MRALTPIRNSVETLAKKQPDLRDVFLCHAWDDRQGAAKELHDLLESSGVRVWFSEKDVALGVPLLRAIDKGLANSKVGIVLVTPALLRRLPTEGIADKELSALLAGERLVPVVHGTTYEALREISPLLASRSGLNTAEDSMANVATKIAELVALDPSTLAEALSQQNPPCRPTWGVSVLNPPETNQQSQSPPTALPFVLCGCAAKC